MTIKCIILDFDGTFTDVEREAAPFVSVFRDAVSDLLGRDITATWQATGEQIAKDPGHYGWVHEGRIVAPSGADPYIRSTSIAQIIFDSNRILQSSVTRAAILQALYHLSYEQTLTAFRPHAKEVLEALAASGIPTFVVTNAKTDAALKKLTTLGPTGLDRIEVHGDARKFMVTEPEHAHPLFARVSETMHLVGLPRPVYPRRGRYFEALVRVMERAGAKPEEAIVCGDIFELDLSLPVQLGMQVHLVTGPHAPPAHEVSYLNSLGSRAGYGDDLRLILKRVGIA